MLKILKYVLKDINFFQVETVMAHGWHRLKTYRCGCSVQRTHLQAR